MVLWSLDPGQNASHIQYETVEKMRSFYSNYTHACPGGTGVNFVSSEGLNTRMSNAESNCIWFQEYIQGMYCCIREVWLPN